MSRSSTVISPSVTTAFFYHQEFGDYYLNPDKAREIVHNNREELEDNFRINHNGSEYDLTCRIQFPKKEERAEELADFYFIVVIVSFEKDSEKIENPFPKSEESIFTKLEEKSSNKAEKLLEKLDGRPYGIDKLIAARSPEKIEKSLIRDNVFHENSIKGEVFGRVFAYRDVDDESRYFFNIPIGSMEDSVRVENKILMDFLPILAYYEKINLFYDFYYGYTDRKSLRALIEEEKKDVSEILDETRKKLEPGEKRISAEELGNKNAEISGILTRLSNLNYTLRENIDSLQADIFNLKSYLNRQNHHKIDGFGSIFDEMKRKGKATLESYKDSEEDLRDLQEYLKMESDIIQNHLEVEESRFNNRMQIAAYIVGFALLFEGIIETLLYIYTPSIFYSFLPMGRLLLTMLFFIPLVIIALWYAKWKKGRFSLED